MNYFDRYKARLQVNGKTINEQITNVLIDDFEKTLLDSPNSKLCIINFDNTKMYDCLMTDQNLGNVGGDIKYLHCRKNTPVKLGDYLQFKDKATNEDMDFKWLTTIVENNTINSHKSFQVTPCNNILKFIDYFNKIVELPCYFENLTLYSRGINEVNNVQYQDNKRKITIQFNKSTEKLYVGQRFCFNNMEVFSITSIFTDITKGILSIMLFQEQVRTKDDLQNNLADNLPPYSIIIDIADNIDIQKTSSYQLHPIIKKNGQIINEELIYTSNNSDIKVDNTGLITTTLDGGGCTITIALKNNPNITKTIEVLVRPSTNQYDLIINGDDYIKEGLESEFNVVIYKNGIIDHQKDSEIQWIYDTNKLNLISKNETTIILEGKVNSGETILSARIGYDNTNKVNKTIQLKGMFN